MIQRLRRSVEKVHRIGGQLKSRAPLRQRVGEGSQVLRLARREMVFGGAPGAFHGLKSGLFLIPAPPVWISEKGLGVCCLGGVAKVGMPDCFFAAGLRVYLWPMRGY